MVIIGAFKLLSVHTDMLDSSEPFAEKVNLQPGRPNTVRNKLYSKQRTTTDRFNCVFYVCVVISMHIAFHMHYSILMIACGLLSAAAQAIYLFHSQFPSGIMMTDIKGESGILDIC